MLIKGVPLVHGGLSYCQLYHSMGTDLRQTPTLRWKKIFIKGNANENVLYVCVTWWSCWCGSSKGTIINKDVKFRYFSKAVPSKVLISLIYSYDVTFYSHDSNILPWSYCSLTETHRFVCWQLTDMSDNKGTTLIWTEYTPGYSSSHFSWNLRFLFCS